MRRFLLIAAVLVHLCGCEEQVPCCPPRTPDRSHLAPSCQVYAFTAAWCQACQRDKPDLARLRQHGIEVVEVDYDARQELARKYQIRQLPTYVVLEDGEEVERTASIPMLIKILRLPPGLL